MGQRYSLERYSLEEQLQTVSRKNEVHERLIPEALQRVHELRTLAAAEQARGVPAEPGSQQAFVKAALEYLRQLVDEHSTLIKRDGEALPRVLVVPTCLPLYSPQ